MPAKRPQKTLMPQREPALRATDFVEVNEGYTMERAAFEAERCIRCQDPDCVDGCPVGVPIPEFIHAVAINDMHRAADILREANPLPAICGRVCPQEKQCEVKCHMGKRFTPVGVGHLERFVADWERKNSTPRKPDAPQRAERVAIIGSGPAGLVCAGALARKGYPVTIFEALHAPGGVLRYGIPEFRLPKEILDWEIGVLKTMGVDIQCNVIIGKTLTLDELFDKMGYSAVFVGTGAGLPRFLNIPGENGLGVYSANEFLTRINLMGAHQGSDCETPLQVGKRVAVIGAGNTAMDAVRCAKRMGAQDALIVYRRSETEMGAREEEYHHAQEEGVVFHWLTNPTEIITDEEGWVTGLRCLKMELGEPDESGRARPVPIEGSEFILPVETVVLAIGNAPNPLLLRSAAGLETTKWGGIVAEKGRTSRARVYAGGDAVTGGATVILAAGAGKRAAEAIHQDFG